MKTTIEFTIHRPFVKEGDYNVYVNGKIASIRVTRIQNNDSLRKMFEDMEFSGSIEISHDYHGVANIWKISMTVPHVPTPNDTRLFVQECLKYLNRLVEVVRYKTKKYWITPISSHDIIYAKIIDMDTDSGKHKTGFLMPEISVYPIQYLDETNMMSNITDMLASEKSIYMSENLILDSYNYFSTGAYNEAVIISNLALEVFVDEYIAEILQRKYRTETILSEKIDAAVEGKFHKVMRRNFFDDRNHESLKKTEPVYLKFCEVRDIRRKVMHPHASKIDIDTAFRVINKVSDVQQFLISNSYQFAQHIVDIEHCYSHTFLEFQLFGIAYAQT